jgi:hypothetical protein
LLRAYRLTDLAQCFDGNLLELQSWSHHKSVDSLKPYANLDMIRDSMEEKLFQKRGCEVTENRLKS